MSVKSTVARSRSTSCPGRVPVTNASTSSMTVDVTDGEPVVDARNLDELGSWNEISDATTARRGEQCVSPRDDKCGYTDARENCPHVEFEDHPNHGGRDRGARGQSEEAAPRMYGLIVPGDGRIYCSERQPVTP